MATTAKRRRERAYWSEAATVTCGACGVVATASRRELWRRGWNVQAIAARCAGCQRNSSSLNSNRIAGAVPATGAPVDGLRRYGDNSAVAGAPALSMTEVSDGLDG